MGFNRIDSGEYKLFNKVTDNIHNKEICKYIGYVKQNHQFFSGTINENLSMLNDNYLSTDAKSQSKIIKTTKSACIYNEIIKLNKKFDSIIDKSASILSGGQKQRLSIARTLLHDKKIYLFDEIFSSLDNLTISAIFNNLLKIKNKIIIITSNNPYGLKRSDQIFLIDNKKLIAVNSLSEISEFI